MTQSIRLMRGALDSEMQAEAELQVGVMVKLHHPAFGGSGFIHGFETEVDSSGSNKVVCKVRHNGTAKPYDLLLSREYVLKHIAG